MDSQVVVVCVPADGTRTSTVFVFVPESVVVLFEEPDQ